MTPSFRDLLLASGDPIFLAPAGRLHDSRLEERFASEFRRSAPGWDILREPLRALAAISRFLAAAPPRSIAPL